MNEGTAPEMWRVVVGWEGFYEVSDLGHVRGLDRIVRTRGGRQMRVRGRLLKPQKHNAGYRIVTLSDGWDQYQHYVHSLVLEAFVGPRPDGYQGCHGDGDPAHNALTNLRWDTISANKYDMVEHGRHVNGSRARCCRGHLLAEPNITACERAVGWRGCLACSRAHGIAAYRRRKGIAFDLQELADEKYAAIMRGVV